MLVEDAGQLFSGKAEMIRAYSSLVTFLRTLQKKDADIKVGSKADADIKVVLGFDEAAVLGVSQGYGDFKFIPANIICRVISMYSNADKYPIWTVFASTNSRVADFAPVDDICELIGPLHYFSISILCR